MTAREEVLSRIHAALAQARPAPPVPREYRTETGEPAGGSEVVSRFLERVEDYQAHVYRATPADLAKILDTVIPAEHRVVLPPALPAEWHVRIAARAATSYVDGSPTSLSATELDDIDTVVTACRVAIAETGTIVLDAAPDQGRRALTLVPDHHVVVVLANQIVASVPEALARLDPTAPLTFISGPSATSDIEFQRVQGVHGPRNLDVIVVDSDPGH